MKWGVIQVVFVAAVSAPIARAEAVPERPDLNTAKPIASCQLQIMANDANANGMQEPIVVYSLQAPPDDPLVNYERTPLGDWYKPADAGRDDPWLRLLLLAPDRPIVVDLAAFIDGKPFRNAREAWIDEVFAAAKSAQAGGADADPSGNNQPDAEGTNTTSESSKSAPVAEGNADSKADEEAAAKSDEPDVTGVKAQARQAPTMRDRLINYLTAAGAEVDRDEVEWLIGEWGSGPEIVVLAASQSWQRAGVAPLLAFLDQDADGGLSAAEISGADALLTRADMDGNDVVEISEIRRATKHAAAAMKSAGYRMVVLVDANTDWDAVAADLARIYPDAQPAAASQLEKLGSVPADITLRVDFAGDKGEKTNGLAVSALTVSPSSGAENKGISATGNVIAVDLGGECFEFSAAKSAGDKKNSDISGSQLAIGAVIDGNPLLRLLDSDQDGRLTLRERQQLSGLLSAIDRDGDGGISAGEIPVPIRLAVTLGPQVHQLLAKPTGAASTIAPRGASKAPEWFASMDKNKDGDLARGEFLGTTEQFRQFDENGDSLLSVAEALKLNAGE
jgi:hypothetical protein